MADDKTFSHSTVSAEDEDDFVIQAGARSDAKPATGKVDTGNLSPEKPVVVDGEHRGSSEVESDSKARRAATSAPESERGASATPPDSYRETNLDDLKNTSMPTMQKIVLGAALLLVLGFIVYYIFLR